MWERKKLFTSAKFSAVKSSGVNPMTFLIVLAKFTFLSTFLVEFWSKGESSAHQIKQCSEPLLSTSIDASRSTRVVMHLSVKIFLVIGKGEAGHAGKNKLFI